jgi:hypothetical protein
MIDLQLAAGPCSPDFDRVAAGLDGLSCATAPAVASARSPLDLANWTLPVVEALMVVGAVAALVHAVLWWRRRGDPTNLGLWLASVVYVAILEPPLYFPDRFGLQDQVGLIFVHNLFSVQFLYDRLPLYIVALYPALTYLAYALVQRTGVLERRGALVGAACVAFVFHCAYEVFDQIGPRLEWWTWNADAPSNSPFVADVPLTSAVMFAGASPFGMALLTIVLIARPAARGPLPAWSWALRVVGVGVLTPFFMMVFSLPYSLAGDSTAGRAAVLWAELALLAAVAVPALAQAVPRPAPGRARPAWFLDAYAVAGGAVYLAVFAVLWATALPAWLDDEPGRAATALAYAAVCAVALAVVLWLAARRRPAAVPERSLEPASP